MEHVRKLDLSQVIEIQGITTIAAVKRSESCQEDETQLEPFGGKGNLHRRGVAHSKTSAHGLDTP